MSALSIYGTQSLNRALHPEFIWLLKLLSELLSARKPTAFKYFSVVSLSLEMFYLGLLSAGKPTAFKYFFVVRLSLGMFYMGLIH